MWVGETILWLKGGKRGSDTKAKTHTSGEDLV